jgi:uncharacterized peroxidase-related enzyme
MASAEMPDSTNALLNKVAGLFGGTAPNIYRALAKNPAALRAFVEMEHSLENDGLLTEGEQAIVALDVSVFNGCKYCKSFFVGEARRLGMDETAIKAICAGKVPESERERVLVHGVRRVMHTHGRLGRDEIADFEEKGLSSAKLLEIITIVSGYTLATYTNNLMRTRIDPEFRLQPDDPCKPE